MGKVIKLKESDIRNLVVQMISEQQSMADETNPLDSIKPSPKVMPAPQNMGNNQQAFKPSANEKILSKKIAVRTGLKRLVMDIEELIVYSGINPQTNNLVRDIKKTQEKFESLFGDPTPETDEKE